VVISVISYRTARLLIERLSLISPSLSGKQSVLKNVSLRIKRRRPR
jgi:hypothetical protein